jgi:hypothetical protein
VIRIPEYVENLPSAGDEPPAPSAAAGSTVAKNEPTTDVSFHLPTDHTSRFLYRAAQD